MIQRGDELGHVRWRFAGEAKWHACAGMREAESGRVQRLTRKIQQLMADGARQRASGRWDAPQVERVAHDGVAAAGEMNTDLVRAPGGEAAL